MSAPFSNGTPMILRNVPAHDGRLNWQRPQSSVAEMALSRPLDSFIISQARLCRAPFAQPTHFASGIQRAPFELPPGCRIRLTSFPVRHRYATASRFHSSPATTHRAAGSDRRGRRALLSLNCTSLMPRHSRARFQRSQAATARLRCRRAALTTARGAGVLVDSADALGAETGAA